MTGDEYAPTTPTAKEYQEIESSVEQVIETVSSWPQITTGEGRFNATIFQLGQRKIGHIHAHPWGLVDISYPPPLREQLLAESHTEEHHVVPNRATTFAIEAKDDIKQAVFLLRVSYLYHVSMLDQAPDIEELVDNSDIDVKTEIQKLELSDELRAVFIRIVSSE